MGVGVSVGVSGSGVGVGVGVGVGSTGVVCSVVFPAVWSVTDVSFLPQALSKRTTDIKRINGNTTYFFFINTCSTPLYDLV